MKEALYAGIILAVLVGLYILAFMLNKRTPRPKGCENLDAECASCPVLTCAKNRNKESEEK